MSTKAKSFVFILVVFIAIIGLGWATGKLSVKSSSYTTTAQQKALKDDDYTLTEMFKYAAQNEYFSQAQYNAIIENYGVQMPFSQAIQTDKAQIGLLLPLFEKNNVVVPENDVATDVILPDSIEKVFEAGIQQEQYSIDLYTKFLEVQLPIDAETVFKTLLANSKKQLAAFESAKSGETMNGHGMHPGHGQGGGMGQSSGQGHQGMNNGGGMNHSGDCNGGSGNCNSGMNHSSNCNMQQ